MPSAASNRRSWPKSKRPAHWSNRPKSKAPQKTAAAEAVAAQLEAAAELARVQAERAQAEQAKLALTEQLLAAERAQRRAPCWQRRTGAASCATAPPPKNAPTPRIAARLESEQAACLAAQVRAEAEQEKADVARQLEVAAEVAAQAAVDKRNAQRQLLDSAQAHADMQRKAAITTRAMADAKQKLAETGSARLETDTAGAGCGSAGDRRRTGGAGHRRRAPDRIGKHDPRSHRPPDPAG